MLEALDGPVLRIMWGVLCGTEIVRQDECRPENPSLASSSAWSLFISFFHTNNETSVVGNVYEI